MTILICCRRGMELHVRISKVRGLPSFVVYIEHILGNHISKTYMVPKNSIGSKK